MQTWLGGAGNKLDLFSAHTDLTGCHQRREFLLHYDVVSKRACTCVYLEIILDVKLLLTLTLIKTCFWSLLLTSWSLKVKFVFMTLSIKVFVSCSEEYCLFLRTWLPLLPHLQLVIYWNWAENLDRPSLDAQWWMNVFSAEAWGVSCAQRQTFRWSARAADLKQTYRRGEARRGSMTDSVVCVHWLR